VIHAAMSQEKIVHMNLAEAQTAIQVLQGALRASLLREQKVAEQLRRETRKTCDMVPAQPGDAMLLRSDAESGFEGVSRNKAGWAAHTKRVKGDRTHLGTYETPVEAARARRDHIADVVAAVALPPVRVEKIKNHVAEMRECRQKYVELYGKPNWGQQFWYQWGRPHSAARLYNILSEYVDNNNVQLCAITSFKKKYCRSKWEAHVAAIHSPQQTVAFSTFKWLTVPMGILCVCYLISLFAHGP